MNTFLQIVIVCTNQCVTEIPRVFTERIVIDTEPKSFHVLNHKHGGGSCVTLAEGMNLPNIRSKLSKMFYAAFYRQALIRILFLRSKIIIKRIFDTVPRCVGNSITFQHPFSYNIRFLGIVLNIRAISTLLVIALNAFLHFINTDFSFDMFLGSI